MSGFSSFYVITLIEVIYFIKRIKLCNTTSQGHHINSKIAAHYVTQIHNFWLLIIRFNQIIYANALYPHMKYLSFFGFHLFVSGCRFIIDNKSLIHIMSPVIYFMVAEKVSRIINGTIMKMQSWIAFFESIIRFVDFQVV